MSFVGNVVVVTGAGSGIGRATAVAFARAGARIVACDIDQPRLDGLADELGAQALLVRRVDVADRAQMAAFADAVHALVPAADVIVNNAGVSCAGNFVDLDLADWDWLLGINLMGVVHGCHFFVPKMIERAQGGQVINIASILGIVPAPQATPYSASKFAVLGFSQSLRVELAHHGIGVTAICPGLINTAIVEDGRYRGALSARRDRLRATFQKGAAPHLVADAIVDAARTNPPIRTVGRDSWALAALARIAPSTFPRLHALVARRLGATK